MHDSTVLAALQLVLAGGVFGPAGASAGYPPVAHRVKLATENFGLTERQAKVLVLILDGHSDEAISSQLGMSLQAVSNDQAAIRRALNVGATRDVPAVA